MRGNREDRPSLGEAVPPRKAAPQCGGTEPPELDSSVPPFGEIHLAEACRDEAELEQAVEVDCRRHPTIPRHRASAVAATRGEVLPALS